MPLLSECPVCRMPLRWLDRSRPLWAQWRCRHCGSLLAVDVRRRVLLVLVLLLMIFSIGAALDRATGNGLLAMGLVLAIWTPVFLLLERAVVLERCGLRCKSCGYDLHGLVTPRCPECGTELDAEQRTALETGVAPAYRRSSNRAAIIVVLLAILLLNLLIAGALLWRSVAAPGAAPPASPRIQASEQARADDETRDAGGDQDCAREHHL